MPLLQKAARDQADGRMTGATIAVCAALALFALTISRPPNAALPLDRRARLDRREHEEHGAGAERRGRGAMRIAWAGYAFAVAALLGHAVYPAADRIWAAMLAAAIASVPLSAVRAHIRGRDKRDG